MMAAAVLAEGHSNNRRRPLQRRSGPKFAGPRPHRCGRVGGPGGGAEPPPQTPNRRWAQAAGPAAPATASRSDSKPGPGRARAGGRQVRRSIMMVSDFPAPRQTVAVTVNCRRGRLALVAWIQKLGTVTRGPALHRGGLPGRRGPDGDSPSPKSGSRLSRSRAAWAAQCQP